MKQLCLAFIFALSSHCFVYAQRAIYSDVIKGYNIKDFDILGKIKNNIIVLQHNNPNFDVLIFDSSMNQIKKLQLNFLPNNADILGWNIYSSHIQLFYKYRKNDNTYCNVIKLNEEGDALDKPKNVIAFNNTPSSTNYKHILITNDNKSYSIIFKTHEKDKSLIIESALVDSNLTIISKNKIVLPPPKDHDQVCENFLLDNKGNLVFTKSAVLKKNKPTLLELVIQPHSTDSFFTRKILAKGIILSQVGLKTDNFNSRYILYSFYRKEKFTDSLGLFFDMWDFKNDSNYSQSLISVKDIGTISKSLADSTTLNDFFIENIFVKKDGGFIITAEKRLQHNSKSNNLFNRPGDDFLTDVLINSLWQYNYYSDILVTSFSNNGNIEWNKIIKKNQGGPYINNELLFTSYQNFYSFTSYITAGQIHYLLNQNEQLFDYSITPNGEINQSASIKNLAENYFYMPRFGKQISTKKILVPCYYRTSICFALIEY